MESVHDFSDIRKSRVLYRKGSIQRSTLLIGTVILSLTASFALGRLSVMNTSTHQVQIGEIELNSLPAAVYASREGERAQEETASEGIVLGSKNSDKYHYPWCSGAKRIKEENKVYFSSIEDARAQGYTPAGNCEGLE